MVDESNPYEAPEQADGGLSAAPNIREGFDIIEPLSRSTGWILFLGIMMLISGFFSVISIWGIIVAWLPIWMGIVLIQASSALRDGAQNDDYALARRGCDKLRLAIKLLGILVLAYIALFILVVAVAIMMPFLIESGRF